MASAGVYIHGSLIVLTTVSQQDDLKNIYKGKDLLCAATASKSSSFKPKWEDLDGLGRLDTCSIS